MKSKKWNLLTLVASIILSIGVMTVFKACSMKDDGTWMKCHSVQIYIFYIGIVISIFSLFAIFIKNKSVEIGISVVVAVLGVLQVLLPETLMSMCMLHSMRCYSVMKPFVIIMGVVIVILSGLNIVSKCMNGGEKE